MLCKKWNGSLADPRTRNDHREDYQEAGPSADFHSDNNDRDDNEIEYDNERDDNEMGYDNEIEIICFLI